MTGASNTEQAIKQAIDARNAALSAKDAAAVMASGAPEPFSLTDLIVAIGRDWT